MKSHYVESIPSVKKLSDIINNPGERALPSRIKTEIINVLEGVERLDGEVKQKEQLLGQKDTQLNQFQQIITTKTVELESTKQIVKKQGLRLEWQEGLTSNLFDTPFDLIKDEIVLQTRLKADAAGDEQIQDYDQKILKLNKELVDEANRIKGEAITKSDHLRADILVQEAWKTDAEWYRREAIKNNDNGKHGIEFRNKQILSCDQIILRLNKELVDEANRIKGEAITKSDHLRADILDKEAWKTDAEWYRREAVKNNDHGEYGIEFRNKQRIGCNQEIYKLIKELIGEANRIKGEAITSLDHLKADILVQEAWKTDAEWCRREVVKYNYHGEHGIEFRNKQLPEYDKEISRLVKELIGEANRIKGEAITPLDHLKADILIQEAWKTDAEWHRREAVKNNDNGVHGIEFRNKQLPEYDKEINRLTKELKSFEINKEEEIVKLKELLSIKESETEELLAQRDKEVKQLEKVNNDVLIKELIEILPQRYPDLYPKNFAEWPNDIWGKQVVDGNDIEAIKHYLPIYRKEVIENLNQLILVEKAKIEELLVEKANVQQKLIDKDNLLSDQTEDIERINVLLETKEIIIQRLEQEKEILQTRHDILDMKMQLTVKEFTVREREKDKALLEKDNELKKLAESSKLLVGYKEEMLKFKELCETKEAEIKEKDELLAQKEIEKAVLVDDLQEKLHFKDSEILGLKMMVSEMDLAGDYQLEHLND